jgi:tRNA threonylcarbamoyladenosine biosynthesis protein TsaE
MISPSSQETQNFAAKLLPNLKANVICLYGDLGAGKTTFVQGLAKTLGIKQRIISPTFIIVREYKIPIYPLSMIHYSLLIHIDCYRLESEVDAKSFNLQEIWSNPQNLVVIEWAERIKHVLPKPRIDIQFKYIDDDRREIALMDRWIDG